MGEQTNIAWCDHTFNHVWGCTNVSPGCDNCYAESFAKRTGHDIWGKGGERRLFGDKHWNEPLRWDRKAAEAGVPAKVFCASMADVFEDHPEVVESRQRLWSLIDATPHLIWQLLTKRPENVMRFAPLPWIHEWPERVWLGTTVEDQTRAKIRIPRLLRVPNVAVRFLSCEPLLDRVTLEPWIDKGIGWVIAGGESGPRHRPLDVDWIRQLRDECNEAQVPFFFKQHGGRIPTEGGCLLDGREYKEFPDVA